VNTRLGDGTTRHGQVLEVDGEELFYRLVLSMDHIFSD
jgi:hypothetical protein